MTPSSERTRRALAALPIALGVAILAQRCIHAILAKVGHPGGTLDDTFIHFQYARAIAEGHPLRYQPGVPITTGATSVLWPALLAPFYALGFRDVSLMWPAWAFSFLAHGLLAWETMQLSRPLAGKHASLAAAAMVLAFGGFAWGSSSGMEVMPFAWALAHTTRLSADWAEQPDRRGRSELRALVLASWLAALFRPEGAVTALLAGATIALFPARPSLRARAFALGPVAAAVATPLLLLALTGSTRSNTTVVKLMVGNPYFQGAELWHAFMHNARVLCSEIWNGQVWSTEFVPTGAAPVVVMGLVSIPLAGVSAKRPWRAALVLALALGMFFPCLYVSFLWNRLRYLWPFATGFFVGLACLSRVVTDLASSMWPRARAFAPVLAGGFAGALAVRLDWTIDDIANCVHGIDAQQVTLGRWAKEHLPKDARIGVNDTGAIAYFSDRRTFDVVGLTSQDEARYWVAGVASRVEHYERLRSRAPDVLPTHFIVYPEWMGTDALFGEQLFDATVTDSSILGGQSMRVYVADYTHLGSGEAPWSNVGAVADAFDVADLESEGAHGYALAGAHDNEQTVVNGASAAGVSVLDGGRGGRTVDRFDLDVREGGRLVARVAPSGSDLAAPASLEFAAAGEVFAKATLTGPDWQEIVVALPTSAHGKTRFEVRSSSGSRFASFHYWSVAP